MADENELKSMILSFRVSELHMLLGFAGRNKTGRKIELQNRAIELLQLGSYPVILKIRNLYNSIHRCHRKKKKERRNANALKELIRQQNQSQHEIQLKESKHSRAMRKNLGNAFVLPSSSMGSPRNMQEYI